jgi:superoxide reductase
MKPKYKEIKTKDPEIGEKHVPKVKISEDGTKIDVVVGETEHPSVPEHFIQWIEVLDGEISLEKIYLTPFSKPKASFNLKEKPENLVVKEFCNMHGTWKSEEK